MRTNVSVVITVLNEEKSINSLLLSLKKQSLQPNEVIIVDGGSTDHTLDRIYSFKLNHPKFPIQLIEESGNISHGRNVGIENSKNEIIALTDAGCIAKKDWLKTITKEFEKPEVSVVAGFYEMKAISPLQKAVAPYHGITKRRFDNRCFLPSARSVAFRKSVWKKVGGFSETFIRAGEDTFFNYALLKANIEIVRQPDALVVWEVPKSFLETAKKFYYYALGDAQTGIWWHPAKKFHTHNLKIVTIFIRYTMFAFLFLTSAVSPFSLFLLIVSFVAYNAWSIWKMREDVIDTSALILVPIIQVMSDISVMGGFLTGLLLKNRQVILKNGHS